MKEKNLYLKQFLNYVSMNVLSMIGLSVYILADTYFISRGIGSNGLAALNIALPVYSLLTGSGLMLGVGGASRFIISKTEGNVEKSSSIFSSAVIGGFIMSLCLVICGIFLNKQLTVLLGANEVTFNMTNIYLKLALIFSPAFILNHTLSAFVKNDKNPRLAMIGMLAGSLFNMLFDYIFIFIFNLGMLGAILATVFSPVIGICILSAHFVGKKATFHFDYQKFRLRLLLNSLSSGLPSLVMELASGIVMLIFNILILRISGNDGVAAYGVLLNIFLVAGCIFNGIAQGAQPMLGETFARGDNLGLRKAIKYSSASVMAASLIFYVMSLGFSDFFVSVFNSHSNDSLQRLALDGFGLYFSQSVFLGMNTLLIMYFVSVGKAPFAQLMTVLKGIVIVIPLAFILSKLLGMTGIWITMPLSELTVFIIGALYFKISQKSVFGRDMKASGG